MTQHEFGAHAGTPGHREDLRRFARRQAYRIAEVIGHGMLGRKRSYRMLPIGDCDAQVSQFLMQVEKSASDLLDYALKAEKVNNRQKVKPLRRIV
jgi:hypothetical protein